MINALNHGGNSVRVATVQQLNQNSTTILHRNLGRKKILEQLKYL